jgi:hypothetical protein
MSNKKTQQTKRWWILTAAAVVVVLVAALTIKLIISHNDKENIAPGSVAETSKPTAAEKKSGDAQKADNLEREKIDQSQTGTNNTSQKKSVNPIITYADQADGNVEVGAFLSEIYENGGTCTLTATRGTNKLTAQSLAAKDATTTNCRVMSIPLSSFTVKGTWTLTVSYDSPTSSGTSSPKDITIK